MTSVAGLPAHASNEAATDTQSELERELLAALKEIAFLRPGGPTRNKLAEQMERIAIDAIDRAKARP